MIRRSLWIGLQLGILAGVGFAIFKTVQARRAAREPAVPPEAWRPPPRPAHRPEPVPHAEPPRAEPPVPAAPAAEPEPMVAAPAEAIIEPEPEPVAAPVKKAVKKAAKAAKKVAKVAKKATKAKKAAKAPEQAPEPEPEREPTVAPPADAVPGRAWVEASEGVCPETHPVKAKISSRIFYAPGMSSYERSRADRCYRDGPSAENEGFRQARR